MSNAHYAYEHVTLNVFSEDVRFGDDAPEPGDRLPEFGLPTVDGGRLQLVKQRMNLMPPLDMIGAISGMMGTAISGLVYACAFAGLSDAHWLGGAVLGAVGWVIAMLVMVPMAGKGVRSDAGCDGAGHDAHDAPRPRRVPRSTNDWIVA